MTRLGGTAYTMTTTSEPGRGVAVTVAEPTPRLLRWCAYGDSYTVPGPVSWAPGSPGYVRLVADRLGLEVVNNAIGGTGWVHSPDGTLPPFLRQAILHPPVGADVVTALGSINDHWTGLVDPKQVRRDVGLWCDVVHTTAPGAAVVVFGPQWPHTVPPLLMLSLRDAVRAGCADRGVRFVDAIGWLTGRGHLVAGDGVHLTAAGLEYVAGLVEPEVRTALA